MFGTRVISSIVLVIIMAAGLFLGGPVLMFLTLGISIIGMMELYRIYKIERSVLGIAGYIFASVYYVMIYINNSIGAEAILISAVMVFMTIYVFTFPKFHANEIMCAYFAFVYVAVMISYILKLRMLENGVYYVWLIFICSWINDTCAYLVGISIGKHKMSPKLSPKKSVEGAVGGIIGSGIIGFLYALIIRNRLLYADAIVTIIPIACCLGATFSIVGDLAASAIKRNYDVKDYGKLIPGHGGVLDRFDSVIFTAPVVFFVINFLG